MQRVLITKTYIGGEKLWYSIKCVGWAFEVIGVLSLFIRAWNI